MIIPVYNAAATVGDAVRSILEQTFLDIEVIVLDDGSDDGTWKIIEEMEDRRLRLVRGETNCGVSHTLNRGLDLANGEFVARMDADDVSHPRRLETQLAFLRANRDVGLCGAWVRDLGGTGRVWRYPEDAELIAATLLFANPIAHPTVMWNRRHSGMTDIRYDATFDGAEDYELWVRLALVSRLRNLPVVLVNYRMHDRAGEAGRKQRSLVATLHARQLTAMGLDFTEEELQVHSTVAHMDLSELARQPDRLLAWFQKLERANKESGFVLPCALRLVLAERYYRACVLAARQGYDGWGPFRRSGYASSLKQGFSAQLSLLLRLKRAAFRKRFTQGQ